MAISIGQKRIIDWIIPATELAAGTAIEFIAAENGSIEGLATIVQTAIVTGGVVTVNINGVAVVGLSNTVADAAAKGDVVAEDTPTKPSVTNIFVKGDRISIVPSAAFNGGGALAGYLRYNTAAVIDA